MPEERSRQLIGNVWRYVTANQSGGNGGSQPFRVETLEIAFNTPGLVIDATGAQGFHVCDVAAGERIVMIQADAVMPVDIDTAWNGSTPRLCLCTTAGRGNMPGTPPTPFQFQNIDLVDVDDTGTGAFVSQANIDIETARFKEATSIYAYVDDGSAGDPGSSQGAGRINLLIQAAP